MTLAKAFLIAAVSVLALIGLVSPSGASASELCSTKQSPCPVGQKWPVSVVINLSLKSSAKLTTTGGEALDTCTGSSVSGKLTNAGSATEFVTGPVESLTWSGCTVTTNTLLKGKLEVESIKGTDNGTVKVDEEFKVTVKTAKYGDCIYGLTKGTDLGVLLEGKPATFIVNAVAKKQTGSEAACPETTVLTTEYSLEAPSGTTLAVGPGTSVSLSEVALCSAQESPCHLEQAWPEGTPVDFSIASGASANLADTEGETIDTCTESTARGKTYRLEGGIFGTESFILKSCSLPTTVLASGSLEIENISSTHNGTVKAYGETKVTISTIFFGSCIYGVSGGADLGELKEGKPATFSASAIVEKLTGSNFACPSTAKWTAKYTLTEPKETTLSVEKGTINGPVLCSTQESPCPVGQRWGVGTALSFSLKSGGSASLKEVGGSGTIVDTCSEGSAKGSIERWEHPTASIESLTWGGCTLTATTTVLGKLEVENIAGTHNGTVEADGETQITVNGGFFGSCAYGAATETDLGELKEGKPATFVVNAVLKKLPGSAGACPEEVTWTGEYVLTEPKEKTLSVETS